METENEENGDIQTKKLVYMYIGVTAAILTSLYLYYKFIYKKNNNNTINNQNELSLWKPLTDKELTEIKNITQKNYIEFVRRQ